MKSKKKLKLNSDPKKEFLKWYDEALNSGFKNPDAMTLATASKSGSPSARIVLYKGCDENGLRFFTNYNSQKGKELTANPKAAIVFYWAALDKQIRVEGRVKKLTAAESDAYWNTRPRESQINAAASPQSSIILDRTVLEKKALSLHLPENAQIPRPKHWGGFCLIPTRFEFWILGEYRFHDRFRYSKKGQNWTVCCLAP